jgi:hypothetical protein
MAWRGVVWRESKADLVTDVNGMRMKKKMKNSLM